MNITHLRRAVKIKGYALAGSFYKTMLSAFIDKANRKQLYKIAVMLHRRQRKLREKFNARIRSGVEV